MQKLMDDLNAALEEDFPEVKGLRMNMHPTIGESQPRLTAVAALGMAIAGLARLDEEVRQLQVDLVGSMDGDTDRRDFVQPPILPVFDTVREQAREVAAMVGIIHRRIEFIRRRI